jgi:hypothetical protein
MRTIGFVAGSFDLTSALAKWYLNESYSADVERYLMGHGPVAISDLTVVEMRSLLLLFPMFRCGHWMR